MMEMTRNEIGNAYGDAVEVCLKFAFRGGERNRDFEKPEFRRMFYEMVTAPVQANYQYYLSFPAYAA
jgi:hypothetical protein